LIHTVLGNALVVSPPWAHTRGGSTNQPHLFIRICTNTKGLYSSLLQNAMPRGNDSQLRRIIRACSRVNPLNFKRQTKEGLLKPNKPGHASLESTVYQTHIKSIFLINSLRHTQARSNMSSFTSKHGNENTITNLVHYKVNCIQVNNLLDYKTNSPSLQPSTLSFPLSQKSQVRISSTFTFNIAQGKGQSLQHPHFKPKWDSREGTC